MFVELTSQDTHSRGSTAPLRETVHHCSIGEIRVFGEGPTLHGRILAKLAPGTAITPLRCLA